MSSKRQNLGVCLIALSSVSYGMMPLFAKMAYSSGINTHTLLFLRFLIATLFMFFLMLVRHLPFPSRNEIIVFLLLGSISYAGQSICYFTALKYASASIVVLLLYTYPALVMFGAAVFLKERITTNKLITLCLALLGAFVIIGSEYNAHPIGIILSELTAIFYAIYILINSVMCKEGMGIQSSAFIMLGLTVVYGISCLFLGFELPADSKGYISLFLLSFISTVVAFWAFLTGIEKTGPTKAALISTLEPVVTVVLSTLLLSEKMTVNIFLGGCLILIALIITAAMPPSDVK